MEEVLFGGAAAGGKTDALLMAALQYAHVPSYAALILMKTFSDLDLAGAGMDRARQWLGGTRARPVDGGRSWRFPSGASLTFGHLDKAGEEQRYRTSEWNYIAFDELTRFPEAAYRFLFSRLRRPVSGPLADVPIRMRAASNPGGKYGEWVKQRFVPDEYHRADRLARFGQVWWKGDRLFVPARRDDNPTTDQESYGRTLANLLPVTRAQLDLGDWGAHEDGHFKAHWFHHYDDLGDSYYLPHTGEIALKRNCLVIVAVDPAGGVSESADYTAIVVVAVTPGGSLLVIEVVRERLAVEHVVPRLAEVCLRRRPLYVVIEEAFLQSAYIREAKRTRGIPTVRGMGPGGKSKLVRATPAILRAEAGQVYLPREAHWLEPFRSELCSFTGDDTKDAQDDQVDAFAWVVQALDLFGRDHGEEAMILGRRGQ